MKRFTAISSFVLVFVLALCACTNTTHVEETGTSFTEDQQAIVDTLQQPEVSESVNLDIVEEVENQVTVDTVEPEVFEEAETWILSWSSDLTGPNDFSHDFETYDYLIVSYDENRCILMSYQQRSLWLADATTGETICLSGDQKVIDYTLAYDTLYWFNPDREVWASSWQSLDYSAKLFCEDAIAVSPFTDECEGAIVSPERANIDYGYGGLSIYSPYGIVD